MQKIFFKSDIEKAKLRWKDLQLTNNFTQSRKTVFCYFSRELKTQISNYWQEKK